MGSPVILHLMGICGAGKTTLMARLSEAFTAQGKQVLTTLDYDPAIADNLQSSSRAFSRELDHLNNQPGGCADKIEEHALACLQQWQAASADVVLVDRWYESYDDLPETVIARIERALLDSGLPILQVLLVVGGNLASRMEYTKNHRSQSWWESGPATLAEWVKEESAYQEAYRQYCERSPFPTLVIDSQEMDWDSYLAQILHALKQKAVDSKRATAQD